MQSRSGTGKIELCNNDNAKSKTSTIPSEVHRDVQ